MSSRRHPSTCAREDTKVRPGRKDARGEGGRGRRGGSAGVCVRAQYMSQYMLVATPLRTIEYVPSPAEGFASKTAWQDVAGLGGAGGGAAGGGVTAKIGTVFPPATPVYGSVCSRCFTETVTLVGSEEVGSVASLCIMLG